ncbi:MAG TPA: 5'-nucleotidase C-terminal domain-containing protein [Longimicrobiales bacterium]|nr:5'-nucleotidase C-terminal domain-containing protein [Longimicrobiales bacterium]
MPLHVRVPGARRAALAGCVVALLAPAFAAAQQRGRTPELTVIQLNDIYRIDGVQQGRAGGPGRVATLISRAEAETGRPVVVLHAGDFIAPSLESRYFRGRQMIDAMNLLDARAPLLAVPGNHEFDEKRPDMLAGAIAPSRFTWLGSNLALHTGDAAADARLRRDTILTAGRLRVGVFALTFLDAPRPYAQADSDVVAAAERQIRALEAAGANVIVGLTHLDFRTDQRVARLRARHPRFLWIAGGHEHQLIHQPLTKRTALITKGDSNARRVWRVALGLDGKRPWVREDSVPLDATTPVDEAYGREVAAAYRDSMLAKVPFYQAVIGRSAVPLDGTEETVRGAESNWADWLTDLMRTAFPDDTADIAVLNGGAIRVDDVFRDTIRWEQLARTFGFPTRVGLVRVTGADVREMLEHSVSGNAGEGRFLQVSGLAFTFDRRRAEGQRVLAVRTGKPGAWTDLVADSTYLVAVPDYIYAGGDGYTFASRASRRVPPGPDLKLMAFDALAGAFARGEAIAPKVEGRIVEVGVAAKASP